MGKLQVKWGWATVPRVSAPSGPWRRPWDSPLRLTGGGSVAAFTDGAMTVGAAGTGCDQEISAARWVWPRLA